MTSMGRPRPSAMARAATRGVDALVVGDGDGVEAPGDGGLEDGLHVRDAVRGERVDVRVDAQQRRCRRRLVASGRLRAALRAGAAGTRSVPLSLVAPDGEEQCRPLLGCPCDDALEGPRLLLDDGSRGLPRWTARGWAGCARCDRATPRARSARWPPGRWAPRSAPRARPARWAAGPGPPKSSTFDAAAHDVAIGHDAHGLATLRGPRRGDAAASPTGTMVTPSSKRTWSK